MSVPAQTPVHIAQPSFSTGGWDIHHMSAAVYLKTQLQCCEIASGVDENSERKLPMQAPIGKQNRMHQASSNPSFSGEKKMNS